MTVSIPRRLALTLLGAAAVMPGAFAQDGAYPDRPIRFVVPYPPGGGTDVIARIVQVKFQQQLGQPIIIDNRGGAGGSVGTEIVAKAPPDGYTVLFTLSSHTINPAIFPKLPFDTARDFAPVGMVASLPQILVVQPGFPAQDLRQLIAMAKQKPGQMQFASVGNGSPSHLAGELLNLRAGTQITHVPYRGGGPAMNDLLGGQVSMAWVSIPAAAQFVKAGKVRALAVSTKKRSAAFPEVPTVEEAGVSDFEVDSWYAMFVPAHTPKSVIYKLNKALGEVVADPDIQAKLLAQGSEAVGGTPGELGKVVDTELVKWARLVKAAHVQVQ